LAVPCKQCRKAAKARRKPALPEQKRCKACLEIKPASEFRKEKTSADGLQYVCKLCKKADLLRIQQTKPPNCFCRIYNTAFYRPPSQKARGDAFCSEACQFESYRQGRLIPKPKRKRSEKEHAANKKRHERYAKDNSLNPPDPLAPKQCLTCQILKLLRDFPLSSSNKDGRMAHCKTCHANHVKSLRATNPRYVITAHEYYLAHKAAFQQRAARYHDQNLEKIRARRKRYLKTHREQVRANVQKRRARLKAAPFIEPINLKVLAERDNWTCHICKRKVTRKNWSVDHLIPLADGGPTSYLHVALAHKRCNSIRGRGRLPAQLRLLP
jgi:5-methylcytosine-specific restriction endonuclease McrA